MKIEALKIANMSFNVITMVARVINISFEQGVFPDQMKTAKVVPIHKEGSKTVVGNDRPRSLPLVYSANYNTVLSLAEVVNMLY